MRTLLELYPGDHIALSAASILVQVTVVMLLAWAVTHWVTRRVAAARHDVWLCALLGVLSSPLIAYTLDRAGVSIVRLPLLPAEQVEQVEPAKVVEETVAEEMAVDEEPPMEAVPFVTALRNRSPVEIWVRLKLRQTSSACVPLPAPGGPRNTSLIGSSLVPWRL